MANTNADSRLLSGLGALLLLLAAVFVWHELSFQREVMAVVLTAVAALFTCIERPRAAPVPGPLGLIVCAVGAGIWFAFNKEPMLLAALSIGLGGAVLAVRRAVGRASEYGGPHSAEGRDNLAWLALVASGLACSWAYYFEFLTLGIAEEETARRMIPTLLWVLAGASLVLFGSKKQLGGARLAGLLFVGAAVLKTVTYDTLWMEGWPRIGAVAVSGGVLLLTGWFSRKSTPPALPRPAASPKAEVRS